MKRTLLLFALLLAAAAAASAQTKIDLAQHGKPPGTSGQLLYNDAGAVGAEDPIVSGTAAAGSAPVNFPVYVAGHDYGSGCSAGPCVRAFKVDASGNIYSVVTNAGTFAVQAAATLAAETTKVIGTVNVAASQTIAATNAGTFAVQAAATLAAETTKVIGTVNVAASQTIAATNAGTFAVQAASTVADGANVTLGAKADAKSTATDTTAVSAISVLKEISAMEQAPASRAVTNAGTFAVQASGAANAGSAPVNFPVYVAGHDYGSGCSAGPCVRALRIDSGGYMYSVVINGGNFPVQATIADGANVTLGAKADAKSTATDTTAITVMQVLKEISAMEQAPASRAVTNAGTFAVQAAGTKSDNSAAPSTDNLPVLPGIARNDYRGGTAATAGRALMPDIGTDGLMHVATLPDTSIKRYRASSKFAASSTTDNWRINGNASNTVLVTFLSLTCTQTTAGQLTVEVAKRSSAGSGGTAATPTVVPMDSNKAAGSSVVNSYTGTGPTVGTLVGDVDNAQVGCMASGTATRNDIYMGNWRTAPIVLRGTAEGLAINLGGAISGGNITVTVEWMEVTTITP